ncbi:hypothetical protein Tco_0744055 [Tanacetum coccineum]
MHNNIMAAGLRDRPPILTTGRYAKWQSHFLRYIDTRPNGDALRKCILEGPYKLTTITILVVPTTDDTLVVLERTAVKIFLHMYSENKAHYQSEKEAIHLLLTGIGDEIYSTYKKEVNEICAEQIAKNANPLALVAAAQQYPDPYYQAPKSHKPYAPPSKQSSSTRSNASTKYKGKEIAKPITPPSESAFEEDSDPKQAQRDKDMQKNLALIAKYFKKIYKPTNNNLITSLNSKNKNLDTSLRYKNDNHTGQFGNQRTVTVAGARETIGSQECKKPKRVKDYRYHKEKMLLCKQAEKGVPLQAEQADWLADTDEEIDEQELEAHYSYMEKIQVVPTADSGTGTKPLEKTDQNAEEYDNKRVALANLIAYLTLDTEENKKILKQLKKANASLTQELKEYKSTLEKTNRTLRESDSTQDSCQIALQNKQTVLETYKTLNNCTVDYDKHKHKLNETLGLLAQKEIDIKEGLKLKAYEISVVKEKHDELMHKAYDGQSKAAVQFYSKIYGYHSIGNDQFAPNLGYGDLVQGNITINKVYYVEGLNQNLLSVGQFCDADLEVAFQKSTCFVRDLQGNDLLTDNRGSNLYTISL